MQVSDKLKSIDNYFSVNILDNGYFIEVSGRNHEDDYATAKVMYNTADEMIEGVRSLTSMDLSD
jgi:hypothetical protein